MPKLVPARMVCGTGIYVSGAVLLLANVAVSRKLLPDLRFGRDKWSPGAIWEIVSTGIWTSINNLGNVLK